MASTTAASADLIVASEAAVATRASQGFEDGQEVVGRRRAQLDRRAGHGMRKPEQGCVQHEARRGNLGAVGAVELAVVDGFADQGMAALGEVNPNLVGASGLEPHAA